MKNLLFLPLLFFSILAQAQSSNSLAVVQRVDSLTKTAREHLDAFQFSEALQAVGEARILFEQHFGKSHPSSIEGCNTEANIHWRMGNYPEALRLCEESLTLQESAFGKENAEYAALLHMRGTLHLEMANYGPGEQDFLACLALRKKFLGKNSAPYAMTLNNLGNLYGDTGDLDKSKTTQLEALRIREAVLGAESYDYSMSLNNLGRLSLRTGEYEKSLSYLAEGRSIIEKTKGSNHPLIANSIVNSAIAYVYLGQYGKAEETFKLSLEMAAASLGKEHPQYAFLLSDMGQLYNMLGLQEKAKECVLQSIEIKEKTIGREHDYTLASIGNLAIIYQEEGRLDEAVGLFLEINETHQRNHGWDHPENLMTLNNLANTYLKKGEFALADSLHRATLAARQRTLGSEHPDCALSYGGLANTLRQTRQMQAAQETMQESLRIFEKTFGPQNIQTINCHQYLAEIAWEMGAPALALREVSIYNQYLREHLIRSAKHLSTNELQLKMPGHLASLDLVHSVRWQFGQQQPEPMGQAYDDALFFKGMLLENALELENSMAVATDSLRQIYLDWKALQRRLADAYSQPTTDQTAALPLAKRAEELEKELVRNSSFLAISEQATWQQVQSRLAPHEAAIEFVHFSWKNPEPTDSVMYIALVLRPGWEAPRWVTLFEEKQIESLLENTSSRQADYASQLLDNQSLYELIWQPLEKHLDGVMHINFSPTGILHRIPLAAIETREGQTFGDRFSLRQLGSTRQLVVGSQELAVSSNSEAVIFGGVKYDMDSTAIASANDLLALRSESKAENEFSGTNRSMVKGGKPWKYLPWTEVEAKTLHAIFQKNSMASQLHLGHAATEEVFRKTGRFGKPPRVLHVATHGYFFPADGGRQTVDGEQPIFKISEHPMIRSGLILAGANHAWTGGEPLENLQDGILTAYEVSQMDLRGTELVVLSACETGLGDIDANEGVYGLQRAFKIAGAKYLLMSLWQVPDFVTQELMTAFYKNWLEGEMLIPEAFHAAQNQVKAERPEAFFWAGFVLVE